jgi:two-component system cell cycle sensor histidine kinase/response regulator CckA
MLELKRRNYPSVYLRYSSALVFTALATLIRVLTMPYIGPRFTYTSYIVSLILTCWYGGLGPGLIAGVLGGLLGAYYAEDVLASRPGGYMIIATFVIWAMHALQRANERLEEEIVERLRLQEEEKRERQWSHITLASIGDAVITTDSAGRVNFINSVAESLTGWTAADARGKPLEEVFEIVNEKNRTPMENPVERVLREGVIVGLANHAVLVRRDGSMVPIDDSAAPVRDEKSAIIGAVLVFRDVTERRRALKEIQSSQERLGLAMDAGRMGAWDWDIRTGKVTWSANLERIHGMEPGSFGCGFEDFAKSVHPDDRERVLSAMKAAADDGGPYGVEYRILQPRGGMAWLEAKGRLILDERGEPFSLVGVCVDITARKLADEELRQRLAQQNAVARLGALALSTRDVSKLFQTAAEVVAHELHVEFASVLEAVADGSLIRRAKWGWPDHMPDVVRGSRNSQPGYTLLASAPVVMENFDAEQRFQHSPELAELGVASGISVVIPGEDRAFGVLAAYATRRRAFTAEDTQFVQAVANITANAVRRQREEEARARLAAVLESSEDAIISHNLDGIVETWNRGAEQVYGYQGAEMIGRSISVLLPADRLPEEVALLEIVRRGEGVQAFETVRVRKDGAPIHVSLTISPIRDLAGKVIAGSHSGRDISERKRVEENLQQTQKLESLGILAGGIAHDFNNLLTGILGNASLISEELSPHSPGRALAESVIQAADRAAHLTRQMLAYSGRGRFLIRPMNCSQQVREITALIAASIPKNVQVRMALAGDLPFIEADTGQFQQLVMNLVINGAEAVGEGPGTVTVSTGLEEMSAQTIAGLTFASDLKPGRYVSLEVRDTGCGMDVATLARIFDPFFTTKFTGRGLGLAAVLGIVRGHSGAVNVRSTPGRGTTFQVLFPVVEAPKMETRDARAVTAAVGGGVILVVDDEDMVRRAAKVSLEKYGYQVVLAEDGKRAVDVLTSLDHTISGVLLDMTMPGMSGEQTFQQMRRIRPDLPVIASSGFSEAEAIARFGLGISGFVQKPYTAAALAAKVAEVMADRRSGDLTGSGGERA